MCDMLQVSEGTHYCGGMNETLAGLVLGAVVILIQS